MKLTYEGEHGLKFEATEPDESLSKYFVQKIADAYHSEAHNFFEEVTVAMRKLGPGEKLVLKSRPIVVTLTNPSGDPGEK